MKQSGAQITNNLSKSIFPKMCCDSYSLLILVMKKVRHLAKAQLFRQHFGTVQRWAGFRVHLKTNA